MFSNLLRPMFLFDADGGGGGGAPAEGTPASGEQTPNAGDQGGKTFTQADIDRLVGDARKSGRSAGEKALLESLGLQSVTDLKGIIDSAKAAEEANKTELQKAQDAAKSANDALQTEKQQREAERTAFNTRLLNSDIRIAASAAVMDKDGKKVIRPAFRTDALDDVTLLIDRNLITEKDGKFEGLDKALEALAKAKPYLLTEEAAAPKGTPRPTGQKRTEPVGGPEQARRTPTL